MMYARQKGKKRERKKEKEKSQKREKRSKMNGAGGVDDGWTPWDWFLGDPLGGTSRVRGAWGPLRGTYALTGVNWACLYL